jgi:hypothetical protein
MAASILSKVAPDAIQLDPFPNVHVCDVLEETYYRALADAYPSLEQISGESSLGDNAACLLSARDVLGNPLVAEIWQDFFGYHTSAAFFCEMVKFWQAFIEQEYPELAGRFGKPASELSRAVRQRSKEKTTANLRADMMLDCQFGMNSPVMRSGSVRGPHIDKPCKLYAALVYFRLPEDRYPGGDLELYRASSPRYPVDARLNVNSRHVTCVKTVPYRANTLVMWLNTARSLHGVSPRPPTDVPRRYINILAESYSLDSDGFFPVYQDRLTRGIAAIKRAAGFRDA